jgi:hypothetical protein
LISLGAFTACLAVVESAGTTTRCSIGTSVVPRDGFVSVLAEPTRDSVLVELHAFDWYDWAGDSFTPKPAPSDSTWGQVFRVVEVLESPSATVELSDEFVAVPWEYDPACHPEPWSESAIWTSPDSQIFFLNGSRRGISTHGPVFDVLGWHAPYPQALFLDFETDEPRETWLDAPTYFDFLRGSNPGSALQERIEQIEDWKASRPEDWGFPLTDLLEDYRRHLRGGDL